jgi:hypothetical protein
MLTPEERAAMKAQAMVDREQAQAIVEEVEQAEEEERKRAEEEERKRVEEEARKKCEEEEKRRQEAEEQRVREESHTSKFSNTFCCECHKGEVYITLQSFT